APGAGLFALLVGFFIFFFYPNNHYTTFSPKKPFYIDLVTEWKTQCLRHKTLVAFTLYTGTCAFFHRQ
ncbi:hypothetical protein, partial [Rothia aeria]|uniref:hypothetical protein n=1 Tax=Rothia aeria TaxID=172042 RepID=UPI0028E547E2